MIVVRNVFQTRFGKAGELARGMTQMLEAQRPAEAGPAPRWRILTDLSSGPFDTVVMEVEFPSLAAWEAERTRMFTDPQFQQGQAAGGMEQIVSGHAELYTVEGGSL